MAELTRYHGRIAPSPTGYLHLGHARTFWTAYERTRAAGGTLVFRNEDGRAHVRLMNGISIVNAGDILPAATGWRVTQLYDLNGDGKKGLVFRNDNGSITVRLMNGLTILGSANLIGPGGWAVVPAAP